MPRMTLDWATMDFPTKLKQRLKEMGLSQADLAERVGTSQSQVSDWVRKKSEPTVRYGAKVAEALGVTMDYLFRDAVTEKGQGITLEEQMLIEAIREMGPDGTKRLMAILVKLALEGRTRPPDGREEPRSTGAEPAGGE